MIYRNSKGQFIKGSCLGNKRDWAPIDTFIKLNYATIGSIETASHLGISRNMVFKRASYLKVRCTRVYVMSDVTKARISKALKNIEKTEIWKRNLANSLKGRKHSPARIKAIVAGVIASRKDKRTMTKPEKIIQDIIEFMFTPCKVFVYTGDRKFFISLNNGSFKCPDFVNKNKRKVIEVFGRYWHRNDNPYKVIELYKEVGYDCLIIWDDEIDINTRDIILKFSYPEIYEDELRRTNYVR